MHNELILPSILLGIVLLFSGYLLMGDSRRRRLAQQMAVATGPSAEALAAMAQERRDIRRKGDGEDAGNAFLNRLIGYDPLAARTWSVTRILAVGGGLGVITLLAVHLVTPMVPALLAGVGAGIFATRSLFKWQRDSYAAKLVRQMPDALQLVVSAVRAGMPVAEAFRILSREVAEPTKGEFMRVADEMSLGTRPDEALMTVWRRTKLPEYAIFATTLSVQSRSGGQLSETMQVLADTVRERIGIAGRANALAGEAKMSAQVLGGMPVVMGIILTAIRPNYLAPFLSDRRGQIMLTYAVTSWIVGVMMMRWMIKKGTSV